MVPSEESPEAFPSLQSPAASVHTPEVGAHVFKVRRPSKIRVAKIKLAPRALADRDRVTPALRPAHNNGVDRMQPRENPEIVQSTGARMTGPASQKRVRRASRAGTTIDITLSDLDVETEHEALSKENVIVDTNRTQERKQKSVSFVQIRQPNTEPTSTQLLRTCKQWWSKHMATLWYIIRKEHTFFGIVAPLPEELAVFTRFQRLLCFYVEIELALAATGLFFGKTQHGGSNVAVVAFMSLLVVSPATLLLPWMFTTAQTIVSTTVLKLEQDHRSARTTSTRRPSLQMHDVVRRQSIHHRRHSTVEFADLKTAVSPFVAATAQANTSKTQPGRRSQVKNNQVVPAHAVQSDTPASVEALLGRGNARRASQELSPLKRGWSVDEHSEATPPNKVIQSWSLDGGKSSALAAKILHTQKKHMDFNREVRDVELEYYDKYLRRNRNIMLRICYITLAFFLSLAFCKCVGCRLDSSTYLFYWLDIELFVLAACT